MGIPVDDLSYLGDPAGMRTLAAELTLRAESIAEVARSLARRVDAMTFEGPAAVQLRDEMNDRRRRADRAALELQEASLALRRGAAQVEDRIDEARAALAREAERWRQDRRS